MRSTIHTRPIAGMIGLAALLVLTGCTGNDASTGTQPGGQDQTAAAGDPDRPADDPDAQARRAGRNTGVLTLGDLNAPKTAEELGAPFDPCALTWADFPAAVRPAEDKKPSLRPVGPDDGFLIRCSFDNSGSITINGDGSGGSTTGGGYFLTSVVWGTDLSADPAKRKGSKARSWNGKPGLVEADNDRKGGKGCVGLVKLTNGVAAASVTNGRFPAVDPCAVVDSVLNAVTKRAP